MTDEILGILVLTGFALMYTFGVLSFEYTVVWVLVLGFTQPS